MARILIADDDEAILDSMLDVLESAGHEVVGVADGFAALKQLTSQHFDVVLFDVMMPKLDGYHAAQQVHGLKNPPKIIVVTARDFDGDKRALEAVGVNAFLSKPFANKDLLAAVESLLK